MISICLNNNKGFRWHKNNGIYARGCFLDKKNELIEGEKMISYFQNIKNTEDLLQRLNDTNGIFSIIIHHNEIVMLICDRIRMFPLFYYTKGDDLLITDDANQTENRINKTAIDEFLAAGFVSGNRTLKKDVFQVQAGELKIFDKAWKSYFYHRYATNQYLCTDKLNCTEIASKVFQKSGELLIKSLAGKTAVVPLSGGFDSRLIAVWLKQYGYQKVICYTYGRKDNQESKRSEIVAKKLGFDWYYVEYNNDLIDDFVNDHVFQQYATFSSNGNSIFFLQEYFAVKYLHENGILPEDSVFIPGHSGDFLGGSHIQKYNLKKRYTQKKLVRKIIDSHYHFEHSIKLNKALQNQLNSFVQKASEKAKNVYEYSIFEDWDMKERLAKLIANSSNVYNFFGYEHRLPFWDNDMIHFFKNLPFKFKKNKALYNQILFEQYFKPFDVLFDDEQKKMNFLHKAKQALKNMGLKYRIAKLNAKDDIYYNEITQLLRDDMKKANYTYFKSRYSYNAYLAQWYVFRLMQ